jgi:hypothetical protein
LAQNFQAKETDETDLRVARFREVQQPEEQPQVALTFAYPNRKLKRRTVSFRNLGVLSEESTQTFYFLYYIHLQLLTNQLRSNPSIPFQNSDVKANVSP